MNFFQKVWRSFQKPEVIPEPISNEVPVEIEPTIRLDAASVAEIGIEVPETLIQQAAFSIGGFNHFGQLLWAGQRYRDADLVPVYLTNPRQTAFRVIAREFLENPHMIN